MVSDQSEYVMSFWLILIWRSKARFNSYSRIT